MSDGTPFHRKVAWFVFSLLLLSHWGLFWPMSLAASHAGYVLRDAEGNLDYAFSVGETIGYWIMSIPLFLSTLFILPIVFFMARRRVIWMTVNALPILSSFLFRYYYASTHILYWPTLDGAGG
jgi:hypothetical protein